MKKAERMESSSSRKMKERVARSRNEYKKKDRMVVVMVMF